MQSKDEKNDSNFGQEEETDLSGTVQGDEQFDSEDADPPLDERICKKIIWLQKQQIRLYGI